MSAAPLPVLACCARQTRCCSCSRASRWYYHRHGVLARAVCGSHTKPRAIFRVMPFLLLLCRILPALRLCHCMASVAPYADAYQRIHYTRILRLRMLPAYVTPYNASLAHAPTPHCTLRRYAFGTWVRWWTLAVFANVRAFRCAYRLRLRTCGRRARAATAWQTCGDIYARKLACAV